MCKTIRAYRVEKLNGGLVSSEKGRAKLILNEKNTISISFITEEHSEYYLHAHPNCCKKTWEMDKKWWDYVDSIMNNRTDKKNLYHNEHLKRPASSDGNVSKNAKKHALTFSGEKWIESINKAVRSDVCIEDIEILDENLNDISTRQKLLEQRGELILKNGEEYYVTKIVNFPDEFQIIDLEDLPEGMEYDDLIPYV